VARWAPLKRQRMETLRTRAVALGAPGGPYAGRGGGPAYRLHADQANRARHTCRQGHTKGPPTAESLWWAGWVVVLTTLAPAVLARQTIMALSRGRWHVAIAIKRWQSVLEVDAVRANAPSPLAEVWLPGPWLYAWMLERRLRRQLGERWGWRDQERVGTWGRVWGLRKDERAPRRTGAWCWKEDAWAAGWKVFMARPRRRPLQQLPPAALDVLYRGNASQPEGEPMAA